MVVKWGIIGPGDFARRGIGPALLEASDTKLTAVYSRSLVRATEFAKDFNADKAYDVFEKFLEDPNIDVVYISTPNKLHAQQSILAANYKKHVLCEKPMAINLKEGEEMVKTCEKNKVKLGVVFQNRYHPAHIKMRDYIYTGELGEIELACVQLCRGFPRNKQINGWRGDPSMTGLGAIVAQGVHPIDLLRFILDSEVDEVQAMTDKKSPKKSLDEMVYCLLKFKNGVYATLVSGWYVSNYDNDLRLYGSKSKIVCTGTLGIPRPGQIGEMILQNDSCQNKINYPVITQNNKMCRLVEEFNKHIIKNTKFDTNGYNGLQMIKIANAISESAQKGKRIKLD